MPYELSATNETGFLNITVTGNRTMETVMGMAAESLSLCIDGSYGKALLDIRELKGALDPLETFEFSTEYLPSLGALKYLKVAVIDREENRNRFQMVMHNVRINGLDLLIFPEAADAKKWLVG